MHNSAVGMVSTYLSAELMQAIGVEGTAGEILSSATGSTLTVAYNVLTTDLTLGEAFSFENLWEGSNVVQRPVLDAAGNPKKCCLISTRGIMKLVG